MIDMVRTRFAPSPTGYLHIGGVRTALFSWLYARKHGGKFILRIEDTDRERTTKEAVDIILEGMQWLGLDYDEGPHYQTERYDRYEEVIQSLLDNGHAYRCYCSRERLEAIREQAMSLGEKPRYDGTCRDRKDTPANVKPVIRFRNPLDGEVTIDDLVQGRVTYSNSELDDLIIARSDGTPTYNLTVVVDDMDMEITHVIRGDDHLNNTPRQINILKALNVDLPRYAHIPLILGDDGKRLSKRQGAANVLKYRDEGYLPEAVINYLVRLGWSHGDQEIFSREEMIRLFDIKDINKSAATINAEKLQWLNQYYLKNADNERLTGLAAEYFRKMGIPVDSGPALDELVAIQKERTKTLVELCEQSIFFFRDFDDFEPGAAKKHLRPAILDPMIDLKERLSKLDEWQDDKIHAAILETTRKFDIKLGKIAQPLRVAVTGGGVSPSIDVTLRLIGKERTLSRLDKALEYIQKRAS